MSSETICTYDKTPSRLCVDRKCSDCGVANITRIYQPLSSVSTSKVDPNHITYIQWQQSEVLYKGKNIKKWKQVQTECELPELLQSMETSMEEHTSHMFRADYQHTQESKLMSESLPLHHCAVVMDFSQNISLEAQDEIESAHWTQTHVTLHPVFIVRHDQNSTEQEPILLKESLIMLSDCLKHDARAVYTYTSKVLTHLKNNPGPCQIEVLHRFSDNCAVQYKCAEAFSHLPQLEATYGVHIYYHYTESGHGKGPSDGLGATTKRKLQQLILGGKVIANAYEAYLALSQNESCVQRPKPKPGQPVSKEIIMYVPARDIERYAPKKVTGLRSLKGTQTFHMIRLLKPGLPVLVCDDLSCACRVCLGEEIGPCYFGQYRHATRFLNQNTGRNVTSKQLAAYAEPTLLSEERILTFILTVTMDCF